MGDLTNLAEESFRSDVTGAIEKCLQTLDGVPDSVARPLMQKVLFEEMREVGLVPGGDSAIAQIWDERARQITGEGWTPEHDDKHARGELAAAAACYALPRLVRSMTLPLGNTVWGFLWPWAHKWWKPGNDSKPADRKRQLVKAAALIVAEIERLDREELKALTDRAGVTVVDEKIQLEELPLGEPIEAPARSSIRFPTVDELKAAKSFLEGKPLSALRDWFESIGKPGETVCCGINGLELLQKHGGLALNSDNIFISTEAAAGLTVSVSKSMDKRLAIMGVDFVPSGKMSADELASYKPAKLEPCSVGTIDRAAGIVRFNVPTKESEASRYTAAAFNDPWRAYEKFFKSDRLVSEFHRATAEQIEDANRESEMDALDEQQHQE